MNLTFKGFLRGYCRELTGLETDSLRKLIAAVNSSCPAAAEAVMVFAAIQGKATYAATLARGMWMGDSYERFAADVALFPSVEHYLRSDQVSDRFAKVWLAYQARKQAIVVDRRAISLMRTKTLEALSQTNATIYSLCRDLRLNRGNVYAYLNKGDVSKVSRNTARTIMEYAQSGVCKLC